MSSKLIRGDTGAIESVDWRKVSPEETIFSSADASGYISEPGRPAAPGLGTTIEQRIEAAHRKGFEEGNAAARQSAAGQLEALQIKFARSIEEVTGTRLRYRREAEQDVVALALAVARRILHRELTVAPDALLGLVKAALDKMEAREIERVRVSRADAGILRQFFEQIGLPQRIEVIADANLAAGSVLLESARGTLDASVDTQLAEIERGFADLVKAST
jgi:flagellar assembly protein FliH